MSKVKTSTETVSETIKMALGRIRDAREALADHLCETLREVPAGTELRVAGHVLVIRDKLNCEVSQWGNGAYPRRVETNRTTIDGMLLAPSEQEHRDWCGSNNHYASNAHGFGRRTCPALTLRDVVRALPEVLARWIAEQESLATQLERSVAAEKPLISTNLKKE